MRTELNPIRFRRVQEPHQHRWSLILAGGDGKRLLPLTRMIAGDDRPKQFCTLVGDQTLLDRTEERVHMVVPARQTMVIVTEAHENFYAARFGDAHRAPLVVQPMNRGTAPAILYGLERLHQLDPQGVAAVFPSDHHIADERAFATDLETAFAAAESHPDCVLLLGIAPDSAEVGYGWIEPGAPLGDGQIDSIRHVRRFWEKPSQPLADELFDRGCLWNSFVMIGRVGKFLSLIERALPQLMRSFASIRSTYSSAREGAALRDLYSRIESINFSERVLSVFPGDLAVLRSANLGWSDLGEAHRVIAVLDSNGVKPEWTHAYAGQAAHCAVGV